MNLIAHVARKDIAQFRGPAGVWAGFVVATTVLFAGGEGEPSTAGSSWADGLATALQLVMLTERLFAALIVALLVLEDAPAADRAFWPTRPISGSRLLLAKTASATVLLLLLPLAGLIPVWLWVGRDAALVARAALDFVATQAGTIAFAGMVAALTRSLPQMMGVACAVAALLAVAVGLGGVLGADGLLLEARRQRWAAMEIAVGLTIVAVLVHQFVTRRTRRSWELMGVGLLGVLGVGLGWRGEVPRMTPPSAPAETRVALGPLAGKMGSAIPTEEEREGRGPVLQVMTTPPAGGARFLVPVAGRGQLSGRTGAPVEVILKGKPQLPESVARPFAAATAVEPLAWSLHVRRVAEAPAALEAGSLRWAGELDLAEYAREFAAELPLRLGAAVQAGSNRLRVLELQRDKDGGLAACVVGERDLWRTSDAAIALGSTVPLDGRSAVLDAYLLRTASGTRMLATDQLGAATKQGVVRGMVKVNLPRDLPATELAGAVLVKVRFSRGRTLSWASAEAAIEVVADKEKS